MTFSAYESSVQSGDRAELYVFYTNSQAWRFTSGDVEVNYGGFIYEPANILRSEPEDSAEINKGGLEIAVARDNPVALLYQAYPPGSVVGVTVLKGHRQDPSQEYIGFWTGRILGCRWEGVKGVLLAESASVSKQRIGLRRKYQPGCPHDLYGTNPNGCGVLRSAYQLTATVSAVDGADITFTSGVGDNGDGYYNGGYIQWSVGSEYSEFRMIEQQVGNVLSVTFAPSTLLAGAVVSIFPGCNRTLAECTTKFGNYLNYGGWPWMPAVLPFNGNNVF